jgi:hypothetical protein
MRVSSILGVSLGQVEDPQHPGVFSDAMKEIPVTGLLLREGQYPNRSVEGTATNVALQNRISIVMDSRIEKHIFNIRWATFEGVKFAVTSIEVKRPRIVLTLGGVYNESTGEAEATSLEAQNGF